MFVSRLFKSKTVLTLLVLSILSFTTMGSTLFQPFPEVIPLPDGFRPEGIAVGNGSTFYVGSLANGAIYRGDLRTGEGAILFPGQAGRIAVGLKFDSRTGLLFVAGGPTGMAFIYDGETGEPVTAIQLVTPPPDTFINDVAITNDAAYFTDSFRPVLYRVPLENNGQLPDPPVSEVVPLGGDFVQVGGFNVNGIAATPNGKTLIIVNSTLGTLYTVDPDSGEAMLIDLGGDTVQSGDGILLHGKTLYVVQNAFNQIAIVELDANLSAGSIVGTITSDFFDVSTTIARFGSSLYAVNARFSTPPTPDTEYDVVRVPRK